MAGWQDDKLARFQDHMIKSFNQSLFLPKIHPFWEVGTSLILELKVIQIQIQILITWTSNKGEKDSELFRI